MKPQFVGAYELGALLGTGTVGEVYRARHRDSGAPAVVKFLQFRSAREPDVQRRFVREVAIAEKLNHPNIVRHYDCGLYKDQIFFAMELVDSGTLKDVLRQHRKLPWREVVECAVQVCAALEHAHTQGVIHRDLKPANLFLSADGRVKVGDFGLARDLTKTRLTLEGQTVGTCRYMPPEQITGDSALTGAVDLYALGCIMYQAMAGRPPFDGESVIEIFEAHLYNQPAPLTELVPDCPRDLADLVHQLLEKDPDERPHTAAETQAALADILRGRRLLRPKPKRKLPPADPAPQPASNLTERLYTPYIPASMTSRRRILLILAATVVAVAVAALAIIALR